MAKHTIGEEWRPVVGWEDRYEVSSIGRVRGRSGKIMRQHLRRGRPRIQLRHGERIWTVLVHRLVAVAFVPGRTKSKFTVNHIDGKKANNTCHNLEWTTPSENSNHGFRIGVCGFPGEANPKARLKELDILVIRNEPTRRGVIRALAMRFGVSESSIRHIRYKQSWLCVGESA